jgi:integrase/recombinase XerD
MGEDIHNFKRKLELAIKHLGSSPISERNKELIIKFHFECLSQGIKPGRIQKYVYNLRAIATWLKKDFDDSTIEDIKNIVAEIEGSTYKDWTKHDYKVCLKKFYRWLKNEKDPKEIEWIKISNIKNKKLPEDLLTEDDIKKLIDSASHPRDKALISVLYETGCRVGELASIKIKNITFDKYGAQITMHGKTGYRRVRVITSVPYLAEWLNKHPLKNPESWLWISIYTHEKLEYESLRGILRHIRDRSGISKSVNPHNFRHSRATYLANFLTEAQMKEYFGWVQASDMASVYVHLSGRDVDKALLKVYGIVDEEDGKESLLKPKKCIRCGETNPCTNILCSKCSAPLDEKAIASLIERDMERKVFENIMDKLWEDNSFKQFFFEKTKELKERGAI